MELAIFAAGINVRRKLGKKVPVDNPPDKRWIKLCRVYTHNSCFEP